MFQQLNKEKVPLLIFSAGLGDIIELTIERYYCPLYDNMKVVSNYMSFDDQVITFTKYLVYQWVNGIL